MSGTTDSQNMMLEAVNPLSPVRRIERKGRKRETWLGGWREIFLEKLESVGLSGIVTVEDTAVATTTDSAPKPEGPIIIKSASGERLVIETKEQFDRVLLWIKSMADDPERLFECHLNLFIDPVPPGKLLNNSGN